VFKKKKILAIIPARSGSKGLKNKNIKLLKKKPLIYWTILRASQSKFIDRIIVTSDYKNLKKFEYSKKDIIYLNRPKKYSQDSTPADEVINHVLLDRKKKKEHYDYIVYLEPTSPLRKKKDIDYCIEKLVKNLKYDTLITLGEIQENPNICKKIINSRVFPFINSKITEQRRQDLTKAYFPYGVCYLSKTNFFLKKKTFYSKKTTFYKINRLQNIEIDDLDDFKIVDKMMKFFFKI